MPYKEIVKKTILQYYRNEIQHMAYDFSYLERVKKGLLGDENGYE